MQKISQEMNVLAMVWCLLMATLSRGLTPLTPHQATLFDTLAHYPHSGVLSHIESMTPQASPRALDDATLPGPLKASCSKCSNLKGSFRIDCFPKNAASIKEVSETSCESRGCCFDGTQTPSCFYPSNYASYQVNGTNKGHLFANFKSPYPGTAKNLTVKIIPRSNKVVTVVISPANVKNDQKNYEEPNDLIYKVKTSKKYAGFQVVRKRTGKVLFDSINVGALIYSSQYVEISAILPSKFIYGLQEVRQDFPVDTNNRSFTLWNHDNPPDNPSNSYGLYPKYLCLEGDGKAHSVTVENIHGMEFNLQQNALTLRAVGPPLAFTFVVGESPMDVMLNSDLNPPTMPPFWSLGSHLSRYGYTSTGDMQTIQEQVTLNKIPLDTQWADIDYMFTQNDFTIGRAFSNLSDYVNKLHREGMHFVPILDPGVSSGEMPGTYPPYDLGYAADIFVKDYMGINPIVGKVWNPRSTVFPDFSNPKGMWYWFTMLKTLHAKLPFDGIWIDMNEPSNNYDGALTGCDPGSTLDNPPYVPSTISGGSLNYRTICMSSLHYGSIPHYSMHTRYGYYEAIATSIRAKRSFTLTRAGWLDTHTYAGKWTGDVNSNWADLKQSVKDIMSFSMLGFGMIGADICGFNGDTTQELCRRWIELGAFYPFSRNHNTIGKIAQDPVSIGAVEAARTALTKRYALLPVLYTLLWDAHTTKAPVIRPTFFSFPDVIKTYNISSQFFWGDALLIVPVLEQGVTSVTAYLGEKTIWYNYNTSELVPHETDELTFPAPINDILLLLRGGYIVPTFNATGALTTTALRTRSIILKVALDNNFEASGHMYWDDGETLLLSYNLVEWRASRGKLESDITSSSYSSDLILGKVELLFWSVNHMPTEMLLNGIPWEFSVANNVVVVDLQFSLFTTFTLTWS